ncbi:MAG: T6SS effector BTH_I2691 family protein, partial [Pseudomonas sp.]
MLDKHIWQAYQVTPDGYLRQMDPYDPPRGNSMLSNACVNADHDIPASFLNIDTREYSTAWLAFASDPWPFSVLQAYKAGRAPERFQVLDLAAVRDDPASVGLVMTADTPQVDQQVYEYQQLQPGRLASVHDFHPRYLRHFALKRHLRTLIPQHDLTQGVLAFVLDDTVGLVQEYNSLRNGWVMARQRWQNEPERAYQQLTSQILLGIRDLHGQWSRQETPSFAPVSGDGPPVFVDPEEERERIVQQKTLDYRERLEERYDESQRASFQHHYDEQLARFQTYIDANGKAYAEHCRSPQFVCIEQHDYDGDNSESGHAYSMTLARCLGGGISEVMPAPGDADTGPTALLWRDWLQNPQSPIYRALLLRDRRLLGGLLP